MYSIVGNANSIPRPYMILKKPGNLQKHPGQIVEFCNCGNEGP